MASLLDDESGSPSAGSEQNTVDVVQQFAAALTDDEEQSSCAIAALLHNASSDVLSAQWDTIVKEKSVQKWAAATQDRIQSGDWAAAESLVRLGVVVSRGQLVDPAFAGQHVVPLVASAIRAGLQHNQVGVLDKALYALECDERTNKKQFAEAVMQNVCGLLVELAANTSLPEPIREGAVMMLFVNHLRSYNSKLDVSVLAEAMKSTHDPFLQYAVARLLKTAATSAGKGKADKQQEILHAITRSGPVRGEGVADAWAEVVAAKSRVDESAKMVHFLKQLNGSDCLLLPVTKVVCGETLCADEDIANFLAFDSERMYMPSELHTALVDGSPSLMPLNRHGTTAMTALRGLSTSKGVIAMKMVAEGHKAPVTFDLHVESRTVAQEAVRSIGRLAKSRQKKAKMGAVKDDKWVQQGQKRQAAARVAASKRRRRDTDDSDGENKQTAMSEDESEEAAHDSGLALLSTVGQYVNHRHQKVIASNRKKVQKAIGELQVDFNKHIDECKKREQEFNQRLEKKMAKAKEQQAAGKKLVAKIEKGKLELSGLEQQLSRAQKDLDRSATHIMKQGEECFPRFVTQRKAFVEQLRTEMERRFEDKLHNLNGKRTKAMIRGEILGELQKMIGSRGGEEDE